MKSFYTYYTHTYMRVMYLKDSVLKETNRRIDVGRKLSVSIKYEPKTMLTFFPQVPVPLPKDR